MPSYLRYLYSRSRRNVLDNTNSTTPAAGGPAVPPVAGARQANPALPADGQNAQGPLGFLNRLFGPPPPARLRNAGQGRQAQQGPNNVQGQAMGQPPGIFINYQVQYQFPRQQLGQQAQQAPQPLHPIPNFPGFPGPGGVWQPWPAVEAPADPIQAEVQEPRTSYELHNPITSIPSSASSSSSDVPQSETPLPTPHKEGSSRAPQDAAALAALSRLRGKKSPETTEPAGGSSQTASTQPTSSSQSESSTTTAQVTSPLLIPLYDLRPSPSPFVTPLQRETAPSQTGRSSNRYPAYRRTQDSSSHSSATPLQHSSVLPQLPPNLTDEQLAYLDRLTRESIDERLRILEGVSGAIYRCIDDLMRLRSAIPPGTMDAISSETVHLPYSSTNKPGPPSTSGTEIKGDPTTRRGKEKMEETVDIESTAIASTSNKDDSSSRSSDI